MGERSVFKSGSLCRSRKGNLSASVFILPAYHKRSTKLAVEIEVRKTARSNTKLLNRPFILNGALAHGQLLTRALTSVYGYNGFAFCERKGAKPGITSRSERGGVNNVTALQGAFDLESPT